MQAWQIAHDPQARCFFVELDGQRAEVEYRLQAGGPLVVEHTRVPAAIGGRGIAAALTAEVLRFARRSGLKVVPVCSYTAAYLRRHLEDADLLA